MNLCRSMLSACLLGATLCAPTTLSGCATTSALVHGATEALTWLAEAQLAVDQADALLQRILGRVPGLEADPRVQRARTAVDLCRYVLRDASTAISASGAAGQKPDPAKVFAAFEDAWGQLERALAALPSAEPGAGGPPPSVLAPRAARVSAAR